MHRLSRLARCITTRNHSLAITRNHSLAITRNHSQSLAITRNHSQSLAITCNHSHCSYVIRYMHLRDWDGETRVLLLAFLRCVMSCCMLCVVCCVCVVCVCVCVRVCKKGITDVCMCAEFPKEGAEGNVLFTGNPWLSLCLFFLNPWLNLHSNNLSNLQILSIRSRPSGMAKSSNVKLFCKPPAPRLCI